MSIQKSTKIVGVGLIQGKKVTLQWEKDKGFAPTGYGFLDVTVASFARDRPEIPNGYTVYEDDPMITKYVFRKLFDKLLSFRCNGSYPRLPYEKGKIY